MAILKVLGFDPAFANWGTAWATVDTDTLQILPTAVELLTTSKSKDLQVRKSSDRLRRAQELANFVRRVCPGNKILFAEVPTGTQSANAAMGLGVAVGVLASVPIPVIQVTPNEIKLRTVGKNTASKDAMINWAYHLYPDLNWITIKRKGFAQLVKKNEHLADALAVIHAGVQSDQFKQLCALYEPSAGVPTKPKISF